MTSMRSRILVALAIGVGSGCACGWLMSYLRLGAGDFQWAIQAARSLLGQENPYSVKGQLYPLPAALFGLPFVGMAPAAAAGFFYGASSALLAFGLTRSGYHRLTVFLAYPYWAGMLAVQWTPLLTAAAFFPLLLPVTLVKPQIGIPVAARFPTRRGLAAGALLLLVSLAVQPHWPLDWMGQFGLYHRFYPILIFPGCLLLLALLRYRDGDAWFLLLMAVMPQRWFYDALVLWLIPKSRQAILWAVFFSWGPGIWRWYHVPRDFAQVGRWMVVCFYLPMLGVLLARAWYERSERARQILSGAP